MSPKKKPASPEERAKILARLRGDRAQRDDGYRERALKLFPHVCGRCGRSFEGKHLRELTVHHKDHNHMNNPADGSNWELLCVYCHDDEHQKSPGTGYHDASTREVHDDAPLDYKPFEGLDRPK